MADIRDNWVFETCYKCKEPFAMSRELYNVRQRDHANFHCPHGHAQHYIEGLSEADKLRQERDRLKQQMAQKEDEQKERIAQKDREIAAAWAATNKEREKKLHERRRVSAARGQVTKLKNRAAAGVCPCCTRHFENLHRHMTTQHPDFRTQPDAADNVIPLKTA